MAIRIPRTICRVFDHADPNILLLGKRGCNRVVAAPVLDRLEIPSGTSCSAAPPCHRPSGDSAVQSPLCPSIRASKTAHCRERDAPASRKSVFHRSRKVSYWPRCAACSDRRRISGSCGCVPVSCRSPGTVQSTSPALTVPACTYPRPSTKTGWSAVHRNEPPSNLISTISRPGLISYSRISCQIIRSVE